MATDIEKRGRAKQVLQLFESGKTTREIEEILNNGLAEGEKPFTQPTIARFLKPYRAQVAKDKRELVTATFMDDLEKLNACIQQNFAVANGHRIDPQTGAPKRKPDGSYETLSYDQGLRVKARQAVISAVLKKFAFLGEEETVVYHEVSGRGGGPIDHRTISDDELDRRLAHLQEKTRTSQHLGSADADQG